MRCRAFRVVWAVGLLALFTGCVERRFVVESNPPGAMVYINNEPKGPTPVDVPFLYYGDYEIRLEKAGFQTKTVKQHVSTPVYEYPFIDFFSEVLLPVNLTDIRPLYYELDPVAPPNLDQLKIDADELRRRGQALPAPRYPELNNKEQPKRRPPPGPSTVSPTPNAPSTFPTQPPVVEPPPRVPPPPILPPE